MKTWMVVLLAALSPPAFSQTLTWNDVAYQIPQHESVQLASRLLSLAQAEVDAESAWKGLKVSTRPVAELTKADLGIDLWFLLGSTAADREKATALVETLALRQREADEAVGRATVDLLRAYNASYLAQQSVGVAEAARDEQKSRLEAVKQRVKQGTLTATAGALAEAGLQDSEAEVAQARLDLRLAWFALAFKATLETPRPDHQPGSQDPLGLVPLLAKPDFGPLVSPGLPVALIDMAKQNASTALAQRQRLEKARRALVAASALPLTFAPQLSYVAPQGSVVLSYSSVSGSLGLGGDVSLYRAPESVIKTVDPVLSASVLLTWEFSGDTALRRQALEDAVELERRRLGYLEASLELGVRSKYAAFLKAQESLAASLRAQESTGAAAQSFASKKLIGQVSPEEEAANAAVLVRATFAHDKAQVNLTLATLELREAASAWEIP